VLSECKNSGVRKVCDKCKDCKPRDSEEAKEYLKKLNELGSSNNGHDDS
jgi:hypothetical protein